MRASQPICALLVAMMFASACTSDDECEKSRPPIVVEAGCESCFAQDGEGEGSCKLDIATADAEDFALLVTMSSRLKETCKLQGAGFENNAVPLGELLAAQRDAGAVVTGEDVIALCEDPAAFGGDELTAIEIRPYTSDIGDGPYLPGLFEVLVDPALSGASCCVGTGCQSEFTCEPSDPGWACMPSSA